MKAPEASGRIGLWSAIGLVISHTVAVGIFLTPAELIGALASPVLTFGLWTTCGVIVLAGAFTFGELASRYPQAGGLYVYLREAYGPRIAFLYGWQSLLVMDPGVTAALAVGASQYVVLLWPAARGAEQWVAVVAIWTLALLSMAGLTFGSRVFGMLTIVKLCTLAGIVVIAFATGAGNWSHFVPFSGTRVGAPPLGEAMALGLISVFFSFGGFWETSRIAGEVRNPRRTLPLALVIGVLSVTAIYLMTTLAFIYLVPPAAATGASEFARLAGEALFGPSGPVVFAAIVFNPWSSLYIFGAIKISAFIYAVLYIWYSIYMSKKGGDNINHDAHLYGALFGLAFTIALIAALQPQLFEFIIEELKKPSLLGR